MTTATPAQQPLRFFDRGHEWLVSTGRKTRFSALRAWRLFPFRWTIGPFVVVFLAHFFLDPRTVLIASFLALMPAGWWYATEVITPQSVARINARVADRLQRSKGVASPWDIKETGSGTYLRLRLPVLRPSLADVPLRLRDHTDAGFQIARVGNGAACLREYQDLHFGIDQAVALVAPPQSGKTVYLIEIGRRAKGAVLTTSTQKDLAEGMNDVRSNKKVWIFNPSGFGGIANNVHWNVLVRCEDIQVARRTARALTPESPDPRSQVWEEQACTYLTLLLNAAAIAGRPLEDVERWVAELGAGGDVEKARQQLNSIFAFHPSRARLINAFATGPRDTRGSVTSMIAKNLAWVADDTLRQFGAGPMHLSFDFRSMILNGETLHAIGEDEGGPVGLLVGAFVTEFANTVRTLAGETARGRLDPPVTMILDEIANTIKLPLPRWTSDMGGRGTTIIASFQSLAQLYSTFGVDDGAALLGNFGTLVMFGGSKDELNLSRVSDLLGTWRRRVVVKENELQKKQPGIQRDEYEVVPVASVADLTNLRPFEVFVLQRGLGGPYRGRIYPTILDQKNVKRVPLPRALSAAPDAALDLPTAPQEAAA